VESSYTRVLKGLLGFLIKISLGGIALGMLIWKGGLNPGAAGLALLNHPGYALNTLVIIFTINLLAIYRWYQFLKTSDIDISFKETASLHLIGLFFVTLIPGGTGGDLAKGYYLYKDTPEKKGPALMTIAVDRLVGLYALLFWGLLGVLWNIEMAFSSLALRSSSYFYLGIFVCYTALIVLFLSRWGGKFLLFLEQKKLPFKRVFTVLGASLSLFRTRPKVLIQGFILTLLVHGGILLAYYQLALALDIDLGLKIHAFVVPMLTLVNGLPLSPGGLGVGEAAGALLYKLQGVTQGASILLLFHFYVIVSALIGAPFYFFHRRKISKSA